MSNTEDSNESSEEPWYSSEEPKSDQPKHIYRILAVVFILGWTLILPGFPLEHSLSFIFLLEWFGCFIMIFSFIFWDAIMKNKRKVAP